MLFYRKRYIKQYTYDVTDEPAPPYIPLALIKQHLRMIPSDTSEDDYLTLLSNVVYKYAEKYTKRTFLTTQFRTFRDTFLGCCFVIRRSPLQSIESIEYLIDGVWLTLSTDLYYYTLENDFSRILPTHNTNDYWPLNIDCRQQSIRIDFTAGYGDDYTSIPPDLSLAMLQHIARLYESRGDCDDAGCSAALPATSRAIYDIYRIRDITGQEDCGYVYG
jgi:uncharacterized phiE125 gp8 family phage protein